MSDKSPALGQLPSDQRARIDAVCARFMDEWNAARRPRIEDYLVKAAPEYQALLQELIQIDAKRRSDVGEAVAAADYAHRFPDINAAWLMGYIASMRRAPEQAPTISHPAPREGPGAIIAGRYKLLEQIGEGGMGTVWVAEQIKPVRRKVALKLIKLGMDSKSVLARFEAERQAVAMMDHPNIAKVLDGGTTDNGRPYFAMEYVKGIPLTKYCDDARLTVPQRLQLFVPIC